MIIKTAGKPMIIYQLYFYLLRAGKIRINMGLFDSLAKTKAKRGK